MPAQGAVTRHTLRQQISDALRDEVLAGRLLPGQEFTVRQIADQYGVSATPVREALVDLSAQGLLDSDQHRGFRVHRFSIDDFRAMVVARSLLVDGMCRTDGAAALVLERAHGDKLASVRRRAEESARAARAGEVDVLIGYDTRFWNELGFLVGNQYVIDALYRLRLHAWAFAVPYLRATRGERWLWSGYVKLTDALAAGEVDEVRDVVADYNEASLKWADILENSEHDVQVRDRPGER